MSLYSDRAQANPEEEVDLVAVELKAKVKRTVEVLDLNRAGIVRWFWRLLLALNLILWSFTSCVAFLVWLH